MEIWRPVPAPQPRERRWVPPSLPNPAAIPSVRRSPPFTGGAGALPAGQLRRAGVKVCKIASLGTGAELPHRPNTARSPELRTDPGAPFQRVPLLPSAPGRAVSRLLSSGLPGTRAGPGRVLGEHYLPGQTLSASPMCPSLQGVSGEGLQALRSSVVPKRC